MSKPKRHLHRDYSTAFCGKDASYILMTYEPGEATCAACRKGYVKEAEKALAAAKSQAEQTIAGAEAEVASRRKIAKLNA